MKRGKTLKGKVKRSRDREQTWRGRRRQKAGALNLRRKRTAELLAAYRRAPKDKKPRLVKLYRISRGLEAKVRASTVEAGGEYRKARQARLRWEKALRAFRRARRNPFPHLSGDTDCDRRVLVKLEAVAKDIGRNIYITSGNRTDSEQKALYDNRHSNPYPVAFCCPCQSNHCGGDAADCTIGGVAIQHVVPASTLRKHGIAPLAGDAVHVEG